MRRSWMPCPRSESEALDAESLAYDEALRKSGHFYRRASPSIYSRRDNGARPERQMSITDCPFAETNEQLGGFILIDAKDLNEAILGGIEDPVSASGDIGGAPY
jgi:hypothetical protein